ncbi:hypothetical protein A2U01_0085122, partial [Trifolium medium]|nr:hypothetical protein [Trifolium medium]
MLEENSVGENYLLGKSVNILVEIRDPLDKVTLTGNDLDLYERSQDFRICY